MLFDPSWERKNHDPFSLTSLISWLRTQPAESTYTYADPENCLLGQWTRSMDALRHSSPTGPSSFEYVVNGKKVDLWKYHYIVAGGKDEVWDRTRSFGNALKRAEEARAREIVNAI